MGCGCGKKTKFVKKQNFNKLAKEIIERKRRRLVPTKKMKFNKMYL